MARLILKWKMQHLTKVIVSSILGKFDYFLAVEGGTGIGKSTLAYHIASGVSREFRKLYRLDEELVEYYYERCGKKLGLTEEEFVEKILDFKKKKAYTFNPRTDLIYSQKDMQKFLSSWNKIGIPDEMINVAFNRDFYTADQKNIVKMLNMFRDHCNLIISCVPSFQNLDNQVKNLCKMKITVRKRGTAIIHTPNKIIYCKDKWDSATNEKIEREWIMKKRRNPNFSKLTTFRGLVKFPRLTKKQEELYQSVKNDKRSVVLSSEMGIETEEQKKDPYETLADLLENKAIKNAHYFEGYAQMLGTTVVALRSKVARLLTKRGKSPSLKEYYWERNEKKMKEADDMVFGQAIEQIA